MSYKKALIGFPLITFLIAFALFYFFSSEPMGEGEYIGPAPNTGAYFYNCAKGALWLGAIPTFLVVIWATKHRFLRHQIASIVLITILISLIYFHIANVIFAIFINGQSVGDYFSHYFDLGLLFAVGMALYSIFVLPFLLPKAQQ